MSLNLHQTLSWTRVLAAKSPGDAQWLAMLSDLQGNILKGHGRRHTANIFVRIDAGKQAEAKAFISALGDSVITALQQLVAAQLHRTTGHGGNDFVCALLTADGYRALGLDAALPRDDAFRAGMAGRPLRDPEQSSWETVFRGDLHLMILLAADGADLADTGPRDRLLSAWLERIDSTYGALTVVGVDQGDQLHNDDGNGIEHFGYVDGRSQPLMLDEDIERELPNGPQPGVWNPAIPLSQVLVSDPGGAFEVSCGSYFVYRKLEQNVRGFKERERQLSAAYGGIGELAGATVVGRFENGFPVLKRPADQDATVPTGKVENDFDYSGDPNGLKCPFAAHVRKTNPRRLDSQVHLMARRGITYGQRHDLPNGDDLDDKPVTGVGLLFMAYQSSIVNQFEFVQTSWANNAQFDFLSPPALQPIGIDPAVGSGDPGEGQQYVMTWNAELGPRFDFSGFVRLRGGGYFFAPSISMLKALR